MIKRDTKVGFFFGTAMGAIGEPDFEAGYIHANLENYIKVPINFCHSGNRGVFTNGKIVYHAII